jgi:signal transduction histidine kinase
LETSVKLAPLPALVDFSRRAAEAREPGSIWPLLVEAAVDLIGAKAALALEVHEDRLRYVAQKNLSLGTVDLASDLIGPELAESLRGSVGAAFAVVHPIPMVAGGDLLGVLALFSEEPLGDAVLELADGLVDVASIAIARAHQFEDLQRSYRELRSSREVIERSEKLRLLGQMAASVSHDLKNILNALSLPIQLLRREVRARSGVSSDSELQSLIDSMQQTIARGVETIDRLREFSRQQPERPADKVQIDDVLKEVAELSRGRLKGTGVVLELDLGAPPPIFVRSSELLNAVLNLVVNAVDAIPNKGRVVVRSRVSGGSALIHVSDDGPGMPPEVERHIFEPFFTTKGEKGTGLGLAMVYAFVRRHGGTITCETGEGAGTTFVLSFPTAG